MALWRKNKMTVKEINMNWSEYDRCVAECQLANYGVIYLDEYGLPIDDIYLTDELNEQMKAS